jgi:hypothetical protein
MKTPAGLGESRRAYTSQTWLIVRTSGADASEKFSGRAESSASLPLAEAAPGLPRTSAQDWLRRPKW